jgi:hypothetical protein
MCPQLHLERERERVHKKNMARFYADLYYISAAPTNLQIWIYESWTFTPLCKIFCSKRALININQYR